MLFPRFINVQAAIIALLGVAAYAAFGGWEFLLVAIASALFLAGQPVIWVVCILLEGGE